MNDKPIQASGVNHVWRNANNTYSDSFLKLELSCQQDRRAGVVILATDNCKNAEASEVDNLEIELPGLLENYSDKAIVYWWREDDDKKRKKGFSGITRRPIFVG